MLKIGLIIILGIIQTSQPQISQDSLDLKDLLREQQVENQLLEQEVEILKSHTKEIRNTVWFSLGGVFGLVLIFAGANWLTQNKLFNNEKNRIINEFDEKLENLKTKYQEELSRESVKLESMISKEISNLDKFTRSKTEDIAIALSDLSRHQSKNSFKEGETEEALKHLIQSILSQAIHNTDGSILETDLNLFSDLLDETESITEKGIETMTDALGFVNEKTNKHYDKKILDLLDVIKSKK